MAKLIDLTGMKFGNWTVVSRAENKNGATMWNCICGCEAKTEKIVRGNDLRSGDSTSCGCIARKLLSERQHKTNPSEICGDYVIMYTLKGEPFYVDLEDYDKVKDICWWINDKGYVKGKYEEKTYSIHRFILDAPDDILVDHKHGKKSRNDNRKSNLRFATDSQNMINRDVMVSNTSGVAGVNWHEPSKKWVARIQVNGKRIFVGSFNNKEEAIKARKEAEIKYFGEWSYDNSQNS